MYKAVDATEADIFVWWPNQGEAYARGHNLPLRLVGAGEIWGAWIEGAPEPCEPRNL